MPDQPAAPALCTADAIAALARWLRARNKVVAITGAGVSTASGIPDYRDDEGQWKRQSPVTYQDFVDSAAVRRRYWARSLAGWQHFSTTEPNAAHRALADLERRGVIHALITQNVDGLHQRAGSRQVVDLHGRLGTVVCLTCRCSLDRDDWQRRLTALNPGWADVSERIAPDGDADIEAADFDHFRVPACPHCGGMMKPAVVFYGESVPAATRVAATQAVNAADGVLVVGSSLMVWSSFRLVRAAAMRGVSIAAVNRGRTRADDLLALKCDGECAAVLDAVLQQMQEHR